EDRHRLAASQRNGRAVYAHGERIAADRPFVENRDNGPFDEAELEQPPLELDRRKAGGGVADMNRVNPTAEAAACDTQGHAIRRRDQRVYVTVGRASLLHTLLVTRQQQGSTRECLSA